MNVEVIKEYQKWADRDYVTPLTCKNHAYHHLLPIQVGGGVVLICPREDYRSELGLSDYLAIQRKIQMAQALWEINN